MREQKRAEGKKREEKKVINHRRVVRVLDGDGADNIGIAHISNTADYTTNTNSSSLSLSDSFRCFLLDMEIGE